MNELKRDAVVLVDFSGLAWTCWEPAVSAQEAGQKALAEHKARCATCEMGDACGDTPRQYDPQKVLLTNLDLKFGTLIEAIDVPVKQWVMVKDGRDEKRRQLLPEYKAQREQKPFDPRPLAEEHVRKKGCRFAWSPHAEADDAIAAMATVLSRGVPEAGIWPKDVIIVSSDKDLWQLWNPPLVRIYLTAKKEWLTEAYMEKKLRVTEARHVRLVKALWGDPSDNIPNAVPRMQKQLLPLIKASDGTLQDFLPRTVGIGGRAEELLSANGLQVATNYDVVGLYDDVPVEWL